MQENRPASSPFIWNPGAVRVHGSLHVGPVIVLLGVVLGARVVPGDPSPEERVPEPHHRRGPVGKLQAGRGVDAVLVDAPELVVHRVVQPVVALFRGRVQREVAVLEDRFVGRVRDHGVSPPVRHRAHVVVVVVCHCIAHLCIFYCHTKTASKFWRKC